MKFSDKQSIKGYTWYVKDFDKQEALNIFQKKNVSEIISRLLAIKHIPFEKIDDFLNPKIRNLLKTPYHLLDMDKAVKVIHKALVDKKKICIFGDYDVDGVTATSLLVMYFRKLGINVSTFIPDRIEDGYGLNNQSLKKIKDSGVDLVITVDCGISSNEPVDFANSIGLNIVITDHHLGANTLPNALAVVNPNRLDETSEYKYLAGVGVAFILCIALNMYLREQKYFENNKIKEPNLLNYLDLVALGTVCDVMPLVNINKAFVKEGLEIFKYRQNIGLNALADVLELSEVNDTYHLGYILGPRINASGRVGDVTMSNKLLSCEDKFEAQILAKKLNDFNIERQNIERQILDKAIEKIETQGLNNNSIIFINGDNWHEGVIGIIASRLKDKYNKPVFVISMNDKTGKASCRSVDKSIDIGSVILMAKEKNLLLSGGGHAMAGGFTFEIEKLDEIKTFITEHIKDKLDTYLTDKSKYADLLLTFDNINEKCVEDINNLGPFGTDNLKPIFILNNVIVLSAKKFGKNKEHLRCVVADEHYPMINKTLIVNIFRINEHNNLFDLISKPRAKCNLIGTLSVNKWMNLNNIQFIVDDVIFE